MKTGSLKKLTYFSAAALLGTAVVVAPQVDASTIYIASDSTAANYPASSYPRMGWGMVLQCFADKSVQVMNTAQGGRSSRSFREEGWQAKIAQAIKPGDTLLIQFGHNDSVPQLPERYTTLPQFKQELLGYVALAKQHNATPVLISPPQRYMSSDDTVYPYIPDYSKAVQQVAQQTGTAFINLNEETLGFILSVGPDKVQSYYIPDKIHFTEQGARLIASMIAFHLAQLNLPVSPHIKYSLTEANTTLGHAGCVRNP